METDIGHQNTSIYFFQSIQWRNPHSWFPSWSSNREMLLLQYIHSFVSSHSTRGTNISQGPRKQPHNDRYPFPEPCIIYDSISEVQYTSFQFFQQHSVSRDLHLFLRALNERDLQDPQRGPYGNRWPIPNTKLHIRVPSKGTLSPHYLA